GAEVDAADKSGETPLFQAILHNPTRAIYLIDHGASVTTRNNKFETPLHVAIFGAEEIDLVKKLLDKGADVNAVDQDGQTPLDQTFDAAMTALLTARGAAHGKHDLATPTSSPLITTLPASPTPLVLTTRLRRAVESDDIYAVQTLLAKGADANAPDVDTSSPLSVALRINTGSMAPTPPNPAILQALLVKGADIDERAPDGGRTLLIRAVLNHQSASLDWLLAQGANVKLRDSQLGATALNYADDPTAIRALLRKGANIDARDAEGNTVLMTNARDGKIEAVRVLLLTHAHVNLKNKRGETALTLARAAQIRNKKQNLSGMIHLLQQAGAK
ncbi:MAG: repeat, subfamily, partial [Chthonomonadaceae bacterium]|nr:repeat, subfamily [Chthonomonadaceae bacterium]